jgi:diguanylate cyclase (GGDEF)-like protein
MRRGILACWALGHVAFVLGCSLLVFPLIESPWQRAPAFLLVLFGYATMLAGVRRLDGRGLPRRWFVAALALALSCFVLYPRISLEHWHVCCALIITAVCGATSATLQRGAAFADLRSQKPAMLVFLIHALFYGVRAGLILSVEPSTSASFLSSLAKFTMFEAAPMLLLSLVREESEARLLAASQTDYLTGLPNRRALFERSERRLREAAEADEAVSVMVFDLDHFKSINDTHGHQIGDEVLKLFAETAERELRSIDLIARLGGEEFVALVVGRSREDARADAQRVARGFSAQAARFDGLAIHATVSVGLAHCSGRDADLSRLLTQADAALYRAKTLGRNRIEQAPALAAAA